MSWEREKNTLNRRSAFQNLSVSDQENANNNLAIFLELEEGEEPFYDENSDEEYVPDEASDAEFDIDIEEAEEYCSDDDDNGDYQQYALTSDEGIHFISKSGDKWHMNPPEIGRIRQHNVVNFTQRRPGPSPAFTMQPLSIFTKIISEEISYLIIRETNRKGNENAAAWNQKNPNATQKRWELLTQKELHAYIGILLYAGCYRSNSEPTKELWNDEHLPLYKAAMSYNRFKNINETIRFDNSNSREERLQKSKSAAIDDVWTMVMANLETSYTPHENMTVDEQLFPYRGRTRFTQYIPSKPAKYGIKLWWLCDAKTYFPLKGVIYTGKLPDEERQINQGERVVQNLVTKFERSGRTIYADNFFTSLNLARNLTTKGLGYVGTVRSNKTFVPNEFKKHKSREIYSTLFGYNQGNVSLCSYVPKKNKAVLLLSTVHYTSTVDVNNTKKKPETILSYNSNKCGVDTMDQMLGTYTCKRATKRWPLAMFYNILDIAALASFIIYDKLNNSKKSDKRRSFLKQLCKELVMGNIKERAKNPRVTRFPNIRSAMESLGIKVTSRSSSATPAMAPRVNRFTCRICRTEHNKQRKTPFVCVCCQHPVCTEHSTILKKCQDCDNNI